MTCTGKQMSRALALILLLVVSTSVFAQAAKESEKLYKQWEANRQNKHEVAYSAATLYLYQYPNGSHAEVLKAWKAAYEKVAKEASQSPAPQFQQSVARPSGVPGYIGLTLDDLSATVAKTF